MVTYCSLICTLTTTSLCLMVSVFVTVSISDSTSDASPRTLPRSWVYIRCSVNICRVNEGGREAGVNSCHHVAGISSGWRTKLAFWQKAPNVATLEESGLFLWSTQPTSSGGVYSVGRYAKQSTAWFLWFDVRDCIPRTVTSKKCFDVSAAQIEWKCQWWEISREDGSVRI